MDRDGGTVRHAEGPGFVEHPALAVGEVVAAGNVAPGERQHTGHSARESGIEIAVVVREVVIDPGVGQCNQELMHMIAARRPQRHEGAELRSEEQTSELQSLMRISYAVFCLKHKIYIDFNSKHNKTGSRTQ